MRTIFLVCNAHLDPVWTWDWEEGAAETLSTFRIAAEFCEACDGFVFNHNEALLYQYLEEYDPALFARIQRLVRERRWHIMGGWYLQPDCNMPSGESLVRQILAGKSYFRDRFGVEPTTATNFDPFGHTRGLVQILRKSGYDSYVFCRPDKADCPLPADDFTWVGYDGSEILGHRPLGSYLSQRGQARQKVEAWLAANPEKPEGIVLWGVGNHGGGPSRTDLEQLRALMEERTDCEIVHGIPEAYFARLRANGSPVPRHEGDLNAWAVGCYTSQARVKQKHRQLESGIFLLEKMASHAAMLGLLSYPGPEIHEALRDLLFGEFHDVLGGTCAQQVEEACLRRLDHGLEIVSRLRARAFFALAAEQSKTAEGTIPLLAYNPHSYPVSGIFDCEFQMPDQNWGDTFTLARLFEGGRPIPCQVEQESGNINLDWRKRVVFSATLQPGRVHRFEATLEVLPAKPAPQLREEAGAFRFVTDDLEVVINARTGLVDCCRSGGVDYLQPNAFLPLVMADDADPWEVSQQHFDAVAGHFALMSREDGSRFSGVKEPLDSVRVIEDGEVRAVVEAVFAYGDSRICQRYLLPKRGAEVELQCRVYWNEKDCMLKLAIPTTFADGAYLGQVAYGVESLPTDGKEVVAQQWTAAVSSDRRLALSCINDGIYGSDCRDGAIRLTLLRAAAYAALPISDRPMVPQDRFSPRIDQGERCFRFWITGSEASQRLARVGREAQAHHEPPMALSYSPSGTGRVVSPVVTLSDETVLLTALKVAEDGDGSILRLFEPTGQARETMLSFPTLGVSHAVRLQPFELKTFRLSALGDLLEVDLMERPLQ